MKKPHQVNKLYSLLLILLGLVGFTLRYLEVGDAQFTALIPSLFGILLLTLTSPIKNENSTLAHIAGILTLVLVLISTIMLTKGITNELVIERKQVIFLLIILGGIYSLRSQFIYFKKQRRKKSKLN